MVSAALIVLATILWWPPSLPARGMASSLPAWGSGLRRPVRASVRRACELEWVEALAAEVRAGRDPFSALVASASTLSIPVSPQAVAAARGGGDVVAALRRDGVRSDLVRGVAACWSVAEGSGAGLAASLATLADSARESERIRRDLRAGLAEPRATAVVLAGLPALGLFLGAMLGADPLGWLLGSLPGFCVLTAGVFFEVVGALWAWRIASSLEADL
ncbi:unannotated protein [freshwater metagenome]